MTVKCVPSKSHFIADALSRALFFAPVVNEGEQEESLTPVN